MARTTQRPRRTTKSRQVHAHLRFEHLLGLAYLDMLCFTFYYDEMSLHSLFIYLNSLKSYTHDIYIYIYIYEIPCNALYVYVWEWMHSLSVSEDTLLRSW
jgi:hypothetical protein